jgi:hypothetical protein
MFFSNNLRSLTVVSNATATTTEPSYSASYVDTVESGVKNYADSVGALTGATAVTVVDALPTGTVSREIRDVVVLNRDTVSHTITVSKKNSGTNYTVFKATLGTLESAVYDGFKWSVYTSSGELKVSTLGAASSTAGVKNGATVTATEAGTGVVHQTTLTLAATPITMRNTEQGGGVKIYDFPEGRILVLGATASIAVTTTSVLADTLNAGVTCNYGIGTVTQSNATVATTEQDIVQVTAFTSSATVDVAGAVAKGVGVLAPFDGTTTPVDAYLNLAVAGATDIDADATVTVSGTVNITWINLGDY